MHCENLQAKKERYFHQDRLCSFQNFLRMPKHRWHGICKLHKSHINIVFHCDCWRKIQNLSRDNQYFTRPETLHRRYQTCEFVKEKTHFSEGCKPNETTWVVQFLNCKQSVFFSILSRIVPIDLPKMIYTDLKRKMQYFHFEFNNFRSCVTQFIIVNRKIEREKNLALEIDQRTDFVQLDVIEVRIFGR